MTAATGGAGRAAGGRASPFANAFAFLQKTGKSLMLPVAALPVAGLLLGIGAANFEWMPPVVSALMKSSGDVIFGNMPLIFAVVIAHLGPRLGKTRANVTFGVAGTDLCRFWSNSASL